MLLMLIHWKKLAAGHGKLEFIYVGFLRQHLFCLFYINSTIWLDLVYYDICVNQFFLELNMTLVTLCIIFYHEQKAFI